MQPLNKSNTLDETLTADAATSVWRRQNMLVLHRWTFTWVLYNRTKENRLGHVMEKRAFQEP